MKFTTLLSDDAVMVEMGRRLAASRVERQKTQAQFAEAAGLSKRTVERLENGASVQLSNLVRYLRVLDKLEGFERLLPETPPNPIELLKAGGTSRVRVRPTKDATPLAPGWVWGDEE